jgi:glucosylceramidase
MSYSRTVTVLILFAALFAQCAKNSPNTPILPPPPVVKNEVDFWLTKADQTVLLQKQSAVLAFGTPANIYPSIEVDETQVFQTIDGFGYALTGGSAQTLNSLTPTVKQQLLQELFGTALNSIGVSYLRISIGASDLDAAPFSYDDIPSGQTDLTLAHFSLSPDQTALIPILKEILVINPTLKIIASPWSPPVWMKDNNSTIGGSLQTQYYSVYAQYFVKYIQAMKTAGITITAITPQNEPLYGGNNPSMLMSALQQSNFIKNNLGPAFQSANLSTKIVVYDHNCDQPDYPISILSDPITKPFVDGSAFHLYGGDISALSLVHSAFPDKNLYFTEQWTSSTGSFSGDLKWHLKNVVIGSMRNWSKVALEWNLSSNATYNPHTNGGCSTCQGAITVVTPDNFTRNVSYYIVAHASKFVPAGSVRIGSNNSGNLNNVAFKTTDGKKVLVVENDGVSSVLFNLKYNGKWVTSSLDGGSVGTYIWL